jgi:hypothetical protein
MIDDYYSKEKGFKVFTYYVAVKNHFQGRYDYFKYGGKTSTKIETFDRRKDRFFFYKLSKRDDWEPYILSNILVDPNLYIGNLVNQKDKAEEVLKDYLRRKQSLRYTFKTDINRLDDDAKSNFIVTDGQHPKLLTMYINGKVCIETLIILDSITGMFRVWNEKIQDPVIWPGINKTCERYRPFMNYRLSDMRQVVLERFDYVKNND